MLETLFMDYHQRLLFQQIAVDEGFSKRVLVENDLIKDHDTFFDCQPPRRTKLRMLRNIVLYESLDSDYTHLDLGEIVSLGLVKDDSVMMSTGTEKLGNIEPKNALERDLLSKSNLMARVAFSMHYREILAWYYRFSKSTWPHEAKSEAEFEKHLGMKEEVIQHLKEHHEVPGPLEFSGGLEGYLNGYFYNARDIIYYSGITDSAVASKAIWKIGSEALDARTDLIDYLHYTARTKLTDEILFLPNPENISDVLRMRESVHIERFREVLYQWKLSLRNGDSALEQKMRKDLRIANRSLRAAGKWREYQRSPVNFWITSIGGHIPILSNILTASYTIGELGSQFAQKNYGWVASNWRD